MKKTYFITLLSVLYATTAFSATPTCNPMPSCESLGYSATISDSCENVLSCPFDTNYKVCLDYKVIPTTAYCAIGDVFYADGTCGKAEDYFDDKVHIPVGVVFMLTDEAGNIVTTDTARHGRIVNLHDLYAQEDYLFDPENPYSGASNAFYWGLNGTDTPLTNYSADLITTSGSLGYALMHAEGAEGSADIYNGENNTKILATLEVCTDSDALTYAKRCISPAARATLAFYPTAALKDDSYVGQGHWYWPSMGEFIQMNGIVLSEMTSGDGYGQGSGATKATYNLVNATLGILSDKLGTAQAAQFGSLYWSSTDIGISAAWLFAITSGGRGSIPVTQRYNIRAVLKF